MTTKPQPLFATTRWSLVRAAGPENSPAALEELCRSYWFPVYAVIRRSGRQPADAQDLAQGFFARLLEKRWLDAADDSRGRFRNYLLITLKRYLAGEWQRDHAIKRGGNHETLSLDGDHAERLYASAVTRDLSPDELFDRRWALATLDAAIARLEAEHLAAGRIEEYRLLLPALTAPRGATDYAAIAASGRMSEGAARVAVHRLRKRFRHLMHEEVARTVTDETEVPEEMACLMRALGG